MQTRFETLLRRVPELARYERAAMTDAQLNLFIRASLMREPTLARTPMLRKLRASGYACEQARFGALFGEVARHAA
jgi:hypothetical protein